MQRKRLTQKEKEEQKRLHKIRTGATRAARRSGKIRKKEGKVNKSRAKTKEARSHKKAAHVRKSRY